MPEPRIRCGDHVCHRPSDGTLVVAYADYAAGEFAWCGWPEGWARISDCTLVKAATDEEHAELARKIVAGCATDMRGRGVRRLYPKLFAEESVAEPLGHRGGSAKFAADDEQFWRDHGLGEGRSR